MLNKGCKGNWKRNREKWHLVLPMPLFTLHAKLLTTQLGVLYNPAEEYN